jgi:hypothetical protein
MTSTSTSTMSYPEPKVSVSEEVQKAVTSLVKAEASAEEKHWLAVEEGLKRFEAGIEFTEIVKEFQQAFWIANKKEGTEVSSSFRNNWYQKAYRIGNVVVKGREWITKKREFGTSFNVAYHESKPSAPIPPVSTPSAPASVEGKTNGDAEESKTASHRGGKRPIKGKPSTSKVVVGGGKDDRVPLDVVVDALKVEDTLSLLLESIEELVKTGKIAYIDLITALLEKAQLPMDTLQSLLQPKQPKAKAKKVKAKELKSLSEIGLEPKLA